MKSQQSNNSSAIANFLAVVRLLSIALLTSQLAIAIVSGLTSFDSLDSAKTQSNYVPPDLGAPGLTIGTGTR